MKKIVSIILFIISVVMIGFGFYILNSNKYIFETVLSKSFDYMIDSYYSNSLILDDMANIDKYKITTNTSFKFDGTETSSIYGDLYISNNKFYLDLDSNIIGKKFIGFESLFDNNKLYLKLKQAMDKFYFIDLTDEDMGATIFSTISTSGISSIEEKDLKILTNHLKNSIVQDLKNNDFEKKSESLTFDNKKINTSQISLRISVKELAQIIINYLENISNDNKAIQVLQKINKDITKNDITAILDNFKEVSKDSPDNDIFEISFYINGFNNILRFEFITLNTDIDSISSDNLIWTLDNYKNNANNRVLVMSLKQNNIELINFSAKESDGNKSIIELNTYDDSVNINGYYIKNTNSIDAVLSLLIGNEKIGDFSYKVKEISKEKEYKLEMNISSTDKSFVFNTVDNIYLNENIPNIDISDSDNIENITESEMERIKKYISDKLTELGLEDYLSSFENDDDYVEKSGYSTLYYETITVDDMKDLIKSETPVVVWFGSQTCSYCASFSEVLNESYWDYYYDINYIDVSTLSDSDLVTLKSLDDKLDIEYTPTVVVLQNGKVKDIKTVTMDKDVYYEFLDNNGVE